ncbi:hypothetical protein M199_gp237 [Halogranum tailed virus 1]|uniref:Uncharacterized protein n=1 Tax=Halogranum tailed virus 1 TaxID=1273749 RepID=R4T6W3_9CAUD|nr:hypothetical protein M199_gp237 [Halogranum tailed virus 1]AGM11429.1 hypothetical protein HGTV1_131 [Halogranum tailed virus 1]
MEARGHDGRMSDNIVIRSSQFERKDGVDVDYLPTSEDVFENLEQFSEKELETLGLRCWKESHYLFPHEWYDYIPEGFEVVTIMGRTEEFEQGVTDNDKRFGVLSYGIIRGEDSVEDLYDEPELVKRD